jgi:hypothetical protein
MSITSKRIGLTTILSSLIAGCAQGPLAIVSDPYAVGALTTDSIIANQGGPLGMQAIANDLDINSRPGRDEYIGLKIAIIDQNYTDYVRRLTIEDQAGNSLGPIGSLITSTVGAVIPAGQTTKALSAVTAGLIGVTSIYDKQFLLTQTIQHLETQMKTDRQNQYARIIRKIKACDPSQYSIGFVIADLETYARAGTMESALQNVQKTLSTAETASEVNKDTAAATSKINGSPALTGIAVALAETAKTTATGCPMGDAKLDISPAAPPFPKR